MNLYIDSEIIQECVNISSQDVTGNTRDNLKDSLRDEMFVKETDFIDEKRRISLKISELETQSLQFRRNFKLLKCEAIEIREDEISISVAYLYKQTLDNFPLRKELRRNSQTDNVDQFSNCQTKYIKTLQKRKDDFIKKALKSSPIDVPSNNEVPIQKHTKRIDPRQLQHYKMKHTFINWDCIDTALENELWQDDKQFHSASMKSLKNEWFFATEDTTMWLYPCWYPISEQVGFLFANQLSVTTAYLMSRQDKHSFKEQISQTSISYEYVESELTKFCKKLSKRKSDFLDYCIKHYIVPAELVEDSATDSAMEL